MYTIKFLDGSEKKFNSLRGADLRVADLRGADLSESNLGEANLSRANLSFTNVYTFTLGKHLGLYHEGYLKIGCQGHNMNVWTEDFINELGKEESYSPENIEDYKFFINYFRSKFNTGNK